MKTISLKSLFLVALLSIFGGLMASAAALPVAVGVGGSLLASLVPGQAGVLNMAIQKEIWMDHLVGNLFKANPHLNFAFNADSFVLNGRVVHIPNAGAKPSTKRNRKDFPATVVIREDADITYVMDEYYVDPMKIENADKYENSYDKRQSIIGEQSAALDELIGDWFYRYWAPSLAAQIKRTTGTSTAAHYGTGNRKLIQLADVKGIQKEIWNSNYPNDGWMCAMDAEMYSQFTDLFTPTQYQDFKSHYNAETGVVGKLFGFTFLDPRSTVLRYDNTATPVPQDPDATVGTTDNAAALFWHPQAVVRSLGSKDFFEDENNPTHYGDIYSAMLRAGGRIKRQDGKGVFALVQANV